MARDNEFEEENEFEQIDAPKSNNKLIYILISFLTILIIGLFAGGWFMYNKIDNKSSNNPETVVEETVNNDTGDSYENVGHIVQFDQMIINLNSSKGKKNYLKLQINIEFRDDDDIDLYKKRKPLLFDVLLTSTSNRTKDELMTIGGKEELKMELKEEFNEIMGKKVIKNIYWKTFVIQ